MPVCKVGKLSNFDCKLIENMVKAKAVDLQLSDRNVCGCVVCKAVKISRTPVPKQREQEAAETRPFERVSTDVKGKLQKDFWGNQYMVTFTCDVTLWTNVYFCQRKSQVKDRFNEFLAFVRQLGYQVKVLVSDGGGEYTAGAHATIASAFEQLCADNDVRQNITSPDTPAQNGVSERLNRTLIEHAKAEVKAAALANEFWSLAVKHVVWVRNRVWHRKLQVVPGGPSFSPFHVLYGRPPKIAMARVFGCNAWRLDFSVKKGSFEPKGKKMIYVGSSANRKGFVLFDPRTRKLRTTFHFCSYRAQKLPLL
jgi:hypothetical protein